MSGFGSNKKKTAKERIPVKSDTLEKIKDIKGSRTYDETIKDLLKEREDRDVKIGRKGRKSLNDLKSLLDWPEEKIIERAFEEMLVLYDPDLALRDALKSLDERKEEIGKK